ncbi:cytosolic protein [Candidatus Micrarchaeota archaeon]|nr:cytosolic protein [Candidatus Micrarchaeota archaeon]
MSSINLNEIRGYVATSIQTFHENRLKSLEETDFHTLLKKKNPYLFRAKNLVTAQELITSFLDAKISSSEEEIFGEFLEGLAIFVAQKTKNASKSSAHGIDFEYASGGTRFLVSVKSGLNWGNSSQWKALQRDYEGAIKILKQSKHVKNVVCVLGIGYGKAKTTTKRGYILQVCGQNFWYMVSGDETVYTKIIEPLGYRARELNYSFLAKKNQVINKFTGQFISEFCDKDGSIIWEKLVRYNSGNMTLKDKKALK